MAETDGASWHIYVGEIPHTEKGDFWVSFESTPDLKTTKTNIYGKCLPCIQNLYEQLKQGVREVALGPAYRCWKVTVVLKSVEECLSLLEVYEKKFPEGHVYGKFGSGRPFSDTKVVVFHTEDETARDLVRRRLEACLPEVKPNAKPQISRACAVLYEDILGDWREWQPVSAIKHPEKVEPLIRRIRKALFWAVL